MPSSQPLAPSPHRPRAPRGAWALLAASVLLAGCGGDEQGPYPLETGRERERPDRPVPPGASALSRLPARDAQGRPLLVYALPEGWQALPPSPMRAISIRIPGGGGGTDGDVSVSWAGGEVGDNVNRWLGQFGQQPLDEGGLARLPRASLVGGPAVLVEARGRFDGGMGGGAPKEGYALRGLVSRVPGSQRVFVKLVGPEALVRAQAEAFDAFAASLFVAGAAPEGGAPAGARAAAGSGSRATPETPPAPPQPSQPGPAQPQPSGLDGSKLAWDLPPGWSALKPRTMMRLMDFRIDGAPGTEGVLTQLSGEGGGIALNVNRWRGQLGQPELSAAEIDALPRVPMLGREAVWVEIPGTYSGMSGEKVEGSLFVGVVCLLERDALFFRLVGPKAEVEPQRDALKALLASLKEGT